MKKFVTLFFIFVFAFALVGCGGGGNSDNQLKKITISGKSSVKVGETKKYELKFEPENYSDKSVTWSTSDEAVASVDGQGNVTGVKAGTAYIYATSTAVTTVKGQKKISVKDSQSGEDYPDLEGYTIKLAYAEHALGEVDPKNDDYKQPDKNYKIKALDEVQDLFNCKIEVVAYPASAPWGPARWSYIKQQAALNQAAYDFYNVPDSEISGFVDNGALLDISEFYTLHGNQMMDDSTKTSGSYQGKLYRLTSGSINIDAVLYYNIGLWEELNKEDPTLEEPAQMFLDGNWDFAAFEEYIVKAQAAMAKKYGNKGTANDEAQEYFAVSGWSAYYFAGFASNDGIPLANISTGTVDIESENKVAAAESVKKIYKSGCADPSEAVDGSVDSWNKGQALFNTGSLWFVGDSSRWPSNAWGEGTTKYGYVPWPSATKQSADDYQPALGETSGWVMPIGRDYSKYGDECNAENIFWAVALWYQKSEEYYKGSADYDESGALQTSAAKYAHSAASQEAYIKVQNQIKNNKAYFDPLSKDGGSISSYYNTGIGKVFREYIKADESWSAAIIDLIPTLNTNLRKAYS